MEALTNSTPLAYELNLKSGETLKSIGDGALYVIKLDKDHVGKLHWTTAGATLQAADRAPSNTDLVLTATRSLENALVTENLLKK